jgi:hypothetical protein
MLVFCTVSLLVSAILFQLVVGDVAAPELLLVLGVSGWLILNRVWQ